jgi:hypothetical protein
MAHWIEDGLLGPVQKSALFQQAKVASQNKDADAMLGVGLVGLAGLAEVFADFVIDIFLSTSTTSSSHSSYSDDVGWGPINCHLDEGWVDD